MLEVGAGSGRDTLALVRAGATSVVLDYSPASLALVERRTHDEDELVRGEAVRLLALRQAAGSSR